MGAHALGAAAYAAKAAVLAAPDNPHAVHDEVTWQTPLLDSRQSSATEGYARSWKGNRAKRIARSGSSARVKR